MERDRRIALVTGATSGIGEAMADKLAKQGYHLILVARSVDKLQKLKDKMESKYSISVEIEQVDLMLITSIDSCIARLREKGIQLNLFVNNAGVGSFGRFDEIALSKDMDVIATNISGFTYLLKAIYPLMLKGGVILQVASTASFAPGPYMAVYYASKAYVLSLSLALREEFKKDDIAVCTLCPGPTATAFQDTAKMQKAGFTKRFNMTATEVVECAYKGMLKKKAIIVPGTVNKLTSGLMQILPVRIGVKLVGMTQQK